MYLVFPFNSTYIAPAPGCVVRKMVPKSLLSCIELCLASMDRDMTLPSPSVCMFIMSCNPDFNSSS